MKTNKWRIHCVYTICFLLIIAILKISQILYLWSDVYKDWKVAEEEEVEQGTKKTFARSIERMTCIPNQVPLWHLLTWRMDV